VSFENHTLRTAGGEIHVDLDSRGEIVLTVRPHSNRRHVHLTTMQAVWLARVLDGITGTKEDY
jgi:hypothetical protein